MPASREAIVPSGVAARSVLVRDSPRFRRHTLASVGLITRWKMTSSRIRDLERVIDGRHGYLQAGPARAIDYIRYALRPALCAAVDEVKPHILSGHDVDIATIRNVVHYTSLPALFAMVSEPSALSDAEAKRGQADQRETDYRFLRLYDTANLNDPGEGAYFLKRFTKAYDVVRISAYAASFVSPDEAATDPVTTRDNLVFWRQYGKDGRGCSISVPAVRFAGDRSVLKLWKIVYGSERAEEDAARLRPIVERLDKIDKDASADADLARHLTLTILESLGEIPYLYKSDAYLYEHECRIVALEPAFDDCGGMRYALDGRPGNARLRMYGVHPALSLTNILSTGSVITLGPTVPNVENVQYTVERLLKSVGIEGVPVKCSGIQYRRTS